MDSLKYQQELKLKWAELSTKISKDEEFISAGKARVKVSKEYWLTLNTKGLPGLQIFIDKKINTPKFFTYNYNDSLNIHALIKKLKINFPVVIKPINEGSSIGVYICTKKNLNKNLKKLRKYNKILVEKYIPGREIQVAVMDNKALGAIELKPKRKFYDYFAKYSSKAKTKHIMPAPLESKKYKEVLEIARKAHLSLGCKGITRSDFRYHNNKFFLLEINTQPGMTNLSLVPEIAAYRGIKFENLVEWMVKDAGYDR